MSAKCIICSIFHILIFAYLVYHIHSPYETCYIHHNPFSLSCPSFWQLISHWHKCHGVHTDINPCPWVPYSDGGTECPSPCSVPMCVQMKMYRKVTWHKSAPDAQQRGLSRSVLPFLPARADTHRPRQVSEEGPMVLRSQLHCCTFS